MKTTKTTALLIGLVANLAIAASAAAQNRCDNPQRIGEVRACEKAKEGPDALRRYIHSTRMIDGLYFYDTCATPLATRKRSRRSMRPRSAIGRGSRSSSSRSEKGGAR